MTRLRRAHVLNALTLRVRGQRQHERAAVILISQIQRRTQRFKTQIRAQSHRIGTQRRRRTEPRIRVRLHGRTNIAALSVSNNQHTISGSAGKQRLQHSKTSRTVTLKQRHLRLQRRRKRGATLIDRLSKSSQTGSRILKTPLLQQVRMRVNTHTQRAALRHRLRQTITKSSGHYASPPSERASTAAAS